MGNSLEHPAAHPMIRHSLRLLQGSGAYLRQQALQLAEGLGRGGIRRRILDGYLIQARKTGERSVTTTILDLPGSLLGCNDPFADGDGRPLQQYVAVGPRDDFNPLLTQSTPAKPREVASDAPQQPGYSAAYALGDVGYDTLACFTGLPQEAGRYLCRAVVRTDLTEIPDRSVGIADQARFFIQMTFRAGVSPADAFIVNVAEDFIQARTGFRLVVRTPTQGVERFTWEYPFPCAYYDEQGQHILLVVSVNQRGQPMDLGWQTDAGVSALLIAKLVFQDTAQGRQLRWAWHHLTRLDAPPFPCCQPGQWSEVKGAYNWHDLVATGRMYNQAMDAALAVSDQGQATVFFVTRVLQTATTEQMDGDQVQSVPVVCQVEALLSVSFDARADSPQAETRLVFSDVLGSQYTSLYARFSSGDAAIARELNIWGACYLGDQPRVVYSSACYERRGDRYNYPAYTMRWPGSQGGQVRYVYSTRVAELAVADAHQVLLTRSATEAGAIALWPVGPGGESDGLTRFWTVRKLRQLTKTSERSLVVSGLAYPYSLSAMPAVRLVSYSLAAGLQPLSEVEPAEGSTESASRLRIPVPTCYQLAQFDADGKETMPAGLLLSYYGAGTQRSYLSKDSGRTFNEYVKFGAAHGVFYLGSPLWQPVYGNIFTP
ncbi:hypothetical protein SB18R_03255 [Pseudomonas oryzihabitans]|nr:hypothetical protein SB9_12490 [Pseudomonas psychrotolerans]KTT78261.1 hypothetical protein SB18R_03255 [Pseudomonas psychrotolerans]